MEKNEIQKEKNIKRKKGINKGKFGSVRNINGIIYVDFRYLGERVRESSELSWNPENRKTVRKQLDRIHASIQAGTFRFSKVFPKSKHKKVFSELERFKFNLGIRPDDVLCHDYFESWYKRKKESNSVDESTLAYYRQIIGSYLDPFFGEYTFGDIGLGLIHKFQIWIRSDQSSARSDISNNSINKILSAMKSICTTASDEHAWEGSFKPFRGYKKLPEVDHHEKIKPFRFQEQNQIINALPDHWKPYFKFSFATGIRQGEHITLKIEDIDWQRKTISIKRALSRDENRKHVIGKAKNKFSRRTLTLNQIMFDALLEQKRIYDQFQGEFFFCSPMGDIIDESNLRQRIWIPTLKKAGVEYRPMIQIRHTFASMALSLGENPLWVSRFMGHRDLTMIIEVYSKYTDFFKDVDHDGPVNGSKLQERLEGVLGK